MIQTGLDAPDIGGPVEGQAGSPPIVFRRDPEAAVLRATLWSLWVYSGVALGGLVGLWFGPEVAVWALGVLAGVYGAAAIAACAMPRPAQGDNLSLDGEGLTLTGAGRADRLRWCDMDDFIVDQRSRLACRLLGPGLVIRIPAAPGLAPTTGVPPQPAKTLRISGGYLASQEEMADALAAFRGRAVGYQVSRDQHFRRTVPTFHLRDQGARSSKTRTEAITDVVGTSCFYLAASGVRGLAEGWDAFFSFWTDPLSHPIALAGVLILALWDLWSRQRKLRPAANALRLDPERLMVAKDGRRRQWRWDAVAEPEIQEEAEPDGNITRRIVFIARHDGLSSNGAVPPGLLPGAVRIAIDDLYDAPLEAIIGRIAALRAGSRSESAAAVGSAPQSVPLPI